MDAVIRTNSGAPLITPWSARGMSNDAYIAKVKTDEHKRAVQALAQKANDSPQNRSLDQSRDFVRQKIEGIRKRLQILKKLFSNNPKEMARALGQIFKELKAALKQYKELIGKEADVGVATLESQASGTPTAPDAADGDTSSANPQNAAAPASPDQDLYTQAEQAVRDQWGQDALTFVKEIRGMVDEIEQKMLTPARIQHTAQKSDKDTDKVFEDAEKDLKDVRQSMDDMERDLKQGISLPGTTLDTSA